MISHGIDTGYNTSHRYLGSPTSAFGALKSSPSIRFHPILCMTSTHQPALPTSMSDTGNNTKNSVVHRPMHCYVGHSAFQGRVSQDLNVPGSNCETHKLPKARPDVVFLPLLAAIQYTLGREMHRKPFLFPVTEMLTL